MASVVPTNQSELIQFATTHLAPFGDNAAAIGIDQPDVTLLATLLTESTTAVDLVDAERSQFRTAVSAKNAKLAELSAHVRTMVGSIKAFANASDDAQTVYDLAQIPMPNPPSPRPAPNTPTNLSANMAPNGTVEIKFVADFSDVSSVLVQRVINNAAPSATDWTIVGSALERTFVDDSVPAGADSITYRLQAQRGKLASPWSQSVNVALFSGQGPTSAGGGGENLSVAA